MHRVDNLSPFGVFPKESGLSQTFHIAESPMIQAFSNTLELAREILWRFDIQTRTPLCGRLFARATAEFPAEISYWQGLFARFLCASTRTSRALNLPR